MAFTRWRSILGLAAVWGCCFDPRSLRVRVSVGGDDQIFRLERLEKSIDLAINVGGVAVVVDENLIGNLSRTGAGVNMCPNECADRIETVIVAAFEINDRGFAIFEARAGWCVIRAMGFKTPM